MEMLLAAFTLGFLGSLHCVGMCGPIALALPIGQMRPASRLMSVWLYNNGRVLTYSLLGALLGFLGMGIALAGYQQILSIVLGTVLLFGLLLPKIFRKPGKSLITWSLRFKSLFGRWMQKKGPQALFITGMLNGLLPCGMIYIALAGATASGETIKGALFMAVFGLGTLPAMFSVSLISSASRPFRTGLRHTMPAITFIAGVLLIVRGLGLGIPYLSPVFHQADDTKPAVIYCHKPTEQPAK